MDIIGKLISSNPTPNFRNYVQNCSINSIFIPNDIEIPKKLDFYALFLYLTSKQIPVIPLGIYRP